MIRVLYLLLLTLSFLVLQTPGAQAAFGDPNAPAGDTLSCADRSRFHDELNNNDDVINSFCGLIPIEVGTCLGECAVAFVESVVNRAYANSTTIKHEIDVNVKYWGAGTKRASASWVNNNIENCKAIFDKVLAGSNTCNYCTDNGSNLGGDSCGPGGRCRWFVSNILKGIPQCDGGPPPPGYSREPVWCGPDPDGPNCGGDTSLFISKTIYKKKIDELAANAPAGCDTPPAPLQGGGNAQPGYGPKPDAHIVPGLPPIIVPFNNLSDAIKNTYVAALMLMTSQLTTTMMQQIQAIGTFFDAKHQLETQRLMQQRYNDAHKDYHPSLQMCEIGTFVRNLADSEKRTELTQMAMSRAMLDRELATGDVKTVEKASDEDTRLKAYIDKFCNTEDNAKNNKKLCGSSGDAEQINADINFTQTIDAPLTIPLNMMDTNITKQEENLFAFLDYIFMHDRFPWTSKSKTKLFPFIKPYQEMRSLIAMRSVAQNSFSYIIGQKTEGPDKPEETIAPFMKALMREMGMEDDDIEERIGKNPSYFAQMEVLTKKIYQHPEFMSNLYDKPANVKRLRAAMTAIKLMQDRDIHEAMMRREMLLSVLLELQLRKKQTAVENDIEKVLNNPAGEPRTSSGSGSGSGGFGF